MEKNSPMNDDELIQQLFDVATAHEVSRVTILADMGKLIEFIKSRDQQIALAARIEVLEKVGQVYQKEEYQDKARNALSMALWKEIRDLKQAQENQNV